MKSGVSFMDFSKEEDELMTALVSYYKSKNYTKEEAKPEIISIMQRCCKSGKKESFYKVIDLLKKRPDIQSDSLLLQVLKITEQK